MSKNIAVKVGGVSRNFSNVPKIQIKEALTGNNIDWIPEDEANDYAITETLRVTENGAYYPSSGKCGFSEVNVRVSGGAGTLIEKNISENGEYYAMDDNADGYSKVSVNVASETNIMTRAEWDALTYEEKVAAGLTVIRNMDGEFQGVWYNYANNIPIDIVGEYFGNASESFEVEPIYSHFIVWQGNWRRSPVWANAQVTQNGMTWDSWDVGSINAQYPSQSSSAQTTILNQITYGENPSFTISDTAHHQTSYGVVIGIRPASNITILAEYFDATSSVGEHTYTFEDDYDAVIVIGTKTANINADSLNVMTGVFSAGKWGKEFAINSAQVPMTQIFENVKANSVITTTTMPNNAAMGSVIIGVNYI